MSLPTPEQMADAQRASLETLFGLTSKAFEGLEKLINLNLQAVRSTLADSQANAQRAASVRDAQELLQLQAAMTQPLAEKMLSYSKALVEIGTATQAEFTRVAQEQYSAHQQRIEAAVENVARNAPAGSETAVAIMKSAVSAANTTYDTVNKAAKQATEIAGSNIDAATNAVAKAAQQSAAQASRVAKK
jgi:phasin family protein